MTEDVIEQLEESIDDDDFGYIAENCMQELDESGAGIQAIEPLLELMERHPLLDFGMSDAIVRYAEQFFGKGYEKLLVSSIERRPNLHNVWMLDRIRTYLDNEGRDEEAEDYRDIIRAVLDRTDTEDEIKDLVRQLI